MSVPLVLAWEYGSIHTRPIYPLLQANQIVNEQDLLAAARAPAASDSLAPLQYVVASLSPPYQPFLASHDQLTSDQKAGLALELNVKVIMSDKFSSAAVWNHVALPSDVAAMLADETVKDDPAEMILLNRRLLETAMPGALLSDFTKKPNTAFYKAMFSLGYGLAMWLLVFAAIGGFQQYFDKPSALSRYISDSAYWVYIVHLPILFQIEVLVAHYQWGFGGIPKFLFYNIVATFFCFLTYHYFVRSTFIGRVLNGRAYPFVAWPGRRSGVPRPAPADIPAPHVPLPQSGRHVTSKKHVEDSRVDA